MQLQLSVQLSAITANSNKYDEEVKNLHLAKYCKIENLPMKIISKRTSSFQRIEIVVLFKTLLYYWCCAIITPNNYLSLTLNLTMKLVSKYLSTLN